MARKTAIKALAKRLPFDTDRDTETRARQAIDRVDEDFIEGVAEDAQAAPQIEAPASRLDAMEMEVAAAEPATSEAA
jgi:hypothetical protein